METLPAEMLWAILGHLGEEDRLRASFTCRRWLELLKNCLPRVSAICITLDATACDVHFLKSSPSEINIAMCLCPGHAQSHDRFLQLVFQSAGREITTLAIEDAIIPKDGVETRMADSTFHTILSNTPVCLRALHLRYLDLSNVRPWTFALLVKLKTLEELYILDSVLPFMDDSLLARMISPSCDTLTHISITNNLQITDKFATALARRCPILHMVDLSGCKLITSLAVLAFAENACRRIAELTYIHVHATMFSLNKLRRCLSSPLVLGGNHWKASALKLEIGYHHDAICLENKFFTNLFIVVFV